MIKNVVKRDGVIKPFCFDRIKNAIYNAYIDVYGNDVKFKENYNFLKPMIEVELNKINDDSIEVEDIQDIVVKCLRNIDSNIFYSYQKYRTDRAIHRELNTDTFKKVKKIINCRIF